MLCYAQPGGGYSVEDYANFHIYEHGEEGGNSCKRRKDQSKEKTNQSDRKRGSIIFGGGKLMQTWQSVA